MRRKRQRKRRIKTPAYGFRLPYCRVFRGCINRRSWKGPKIMRKQLMLPQRCRGRGSTRWQHFSPSFKKMVTKLLRNIRGRQRFLQERLIMHVAWVIQRSHRGNSRLFQRERGAPMERTQPREILHGPSNQFTIVFMKNTGSQRDGSNKRSIRISPPREGNRSHSTRHSLLRPSRRAPPGKQLKSFPRINRREPHTGPRLVETNTRKKFSKLSDMVHAHT